MKRLIILTFVFFYSFTFAQTCNLTLDDILEIDSQENFERVLIENNFQNVTSNEELKEEFSFSQSKDTLQLVYSFEGRRFNSSHSRILAVGAFVEKSDSFLVALLILDPLDEYSIYNSIFSEVKEKCSFDQVFTNEEGFSSSLYNCPDTSFNGGIGFGINKEAGVIIFRDQNLEEIEGQNSVSDYSLPLESKEVEKETSSGYYGDGGGNYKLGNRNVVTMPKPTYDCNEQGKVVVNISVDQSGRVIAAQPGVKGTTNSAACLLKRAKEAALKTKFNSDRNAPSKQVGSIIYNFSLN